MSKQNGIFDNIYNLLGSVPTTRLLILTLPLILLFNSYSQKILDQSYAESQFPVPFYVGQLAFDGDRIKQYYAHMLEHQTLDVYVHTQIIDFAFILSTLLLHGVALLILARMQVRDSRWYRATMTLFFIAPLAPLFDALENAVSFIMLADPLGFPSGVALIYSGFAAAKFSIFVLVYLGAALFLMSGLINLGKRLLTSK